MKYCNGQKWGAKKHSLAFSMYPLSRQITFGRNVGSFYCCFVRKKPWRKVMQLGKWTFSRPTESTYPKNHLKYKWQHKHLQILPFWWSHVYQPIKSELQPAGGIFYIFGDTFLKWCLISDDRKDTCCSQTKALRRVLLVLFGVVVYYWYLFNIV